MECPKVYRIKQRKQDKKALYDKFREEVQQRDRNMCQLCGKINNPKYDMNIVEPHHIWGRIGKLLLDVKKAISLCRLCHSKIQLRYDLRPILQRRVDDKYKEVSHD